ncbi:MAG: amidohydrolase family protein [Myxococcota bacterium]
MRTWLQGATVVDGTESEPRPGGVLIDGDRIEAVGDLQVEDANIIDCTGKVVAPGFIDAHSHMDFFTASDNPHHFDSFTAQGVTTFVTGNCGFSPFGYAPGTPHRKLLENSLFKAGRDGLDWNTFEEYREVLGALGPTHNLLHFVGHGTSRTSISGFEARRLSSTEHERLCWLLEEAMDQGAAGVSLGLQYKPGVFADAAELDDVARLVKRHDKLLTVHARAFSAFSGTYPPIPFGKPHNLRAIEDMLAVARRTGVRLQFSHLIFVGSRAWETVDEALRLFDEAIAEGVDVQFDLFPYTCGATLLNTLLPDWFMARMPGALHEFTSRTRLRLEAMVGFKLAGFGYDNMQLGNACCPDYDAYNGLFIPEIAKRVGRSEFDVMLDILDKSDIEARALFHDYYRDDIVERLMQHPAALFMTDAWPEPGGHQNPAAYGAFPRFLRIAREQRSVSLETAVHKMTDASAQRFRLVDRGRLEAGFAADVVVFDWDAIQDQPGRAGDGAPVGVEHVFVNGNHVLEGGKVTARRGAGRLLNVD